jgi:hypothetical protein
MTHSIDPASLEPAEHVAEPPEVMEGWRAADLSEDELVDDEFIAEDPESWEVTEEWQFPDSRLTN